MRGIVVNARRKDIGDLLTETTLRRSNVLNASKQLIEIVEGLIGILKPLVVEHKAFDDIFTKLLRGPDAEASGDGALDAVPNRDNGVEVVVFDLAPD